jgi:hypothetical protein
MSFPRRSFRGFKLPARRPLVEQTPYRDDGASPSAQLAQGSRSRETMDTMTACRPTPSSAQLAQGLGSGETVHTPAAYRPTLPGEPGYQSPHSLADTQHCSPYLTGMHGFMTDFDTPSPTYMVEFFNDVEIGDINGAHAALAVDTIEQELAEQDLRPDQLLLIGM